MSTIQELLTAAPANITSLEVSLDSLNSDIANLQDTKENLTEDVLIKSKDTLEEWSVVKMAYFLSLEPDPANVEFRLNKGGSYWDGSIFKLSVRVIVTTNIASLSGPATLDGIDCIEGDRVLLTDQNNKVYNGIWIVHTDDWTRAEDYLDGQSAYDTFTFAREGTAQAYKYWMCTTESPDDIIGTNNLNFSNVNSSDTTNINDWIIQRRQKIGAIWGFWLNYYSYDDAVADGDETVITTNEDFNYGLNYIRQDPTDLTGSYGIDANIRMRLIGVGVLEDDLVQQEETVTVLTRLLVV